MKAFYFCALLILLIHGVLVHTHPHDLDEDHHDDHDQDHEDHDDVDADLFQQDELHDESLDVESESPNLDDSVSQEQLLSVLEELNLNTENIDLDEFFDENQDHEVRCTIFSKLCFKVLNYPIKSRASKNSVSVLTFLHHTKTVNF